ncbi:MAG: ferritin family protein [Sedimentisphaerales bacterium]|nr:ferritin family protein [Sedimentisphaerales bacterium]
MAMNFTALEIVEIAEQLERNGAKFYRLAAEKAKDESAKKLFSELAEMEDGHEQIFVDMKKSIQDETEDATVFDPDDEIVSYLSAIAKSVGWEGKLAPKIELTGSEGPQEVLKSAIEAEKAAINYYVGLKVLVASKAGKNSVDEIIKEEMSHVVALQEQLEDL